jgi:hypothetical protein
MKTETSLWLFLICLWPIGFVILWAIWNNLRDSGDEKRVEKSLNWPETQVIVLSTEVEWAHVQVNYEYLVAGTKYQGKYEISLSPVAPDQYGRGVARLNAEVKQEMDDYPPGCGVVIRYNPTDPSESVLFCRSGKIQSGTL